MKTITFLPKKEADLREQIIFGEMYNEDNYRFGIRRFNTLTVDKLELLIEHGFIKLSDRQNYAPEVHEIIDFAHEHPGTEWIFEGYAVSIKRNDVRVSIDGFGSERAGGVNDVIDFLLMNRYADELSGGVNEELRCWYD